MFVASLLDGVASGIANIGCWRRVVSLRLDIGVLTDSCGVVGLQILY